MRKQNRDTLNGSLKYPDMPCRHGVQNVQNVFVAGTSVPDGDPNLSQSESATPMAFCTGLSKLSKISPANADVV